MSDVDLTVYIVICRYSHHEKIPLHYEAHVRWAEKYAASGNLLLAGPAPSNRDGAVIAQAPSREALMAILHEDSFYPAGLVEHEIFEFIPRRGSLRNSPENPLFLDAAARQAAFARSFEGV